MKKFFLIIMLLSVGGSAVGFGQRLKRHAISSLGTNHVMYGANACTAITLGQPPNAGTITDGATLILRQGFQQPNPDQCAIKISFTVDKKDNGGCGTYYVFEYTGDVTPTTSISWQFGANAAPMIADGPVSPEIGFSKTGPQEVLVTVSDGVCQKTVMQFVDADGTPFLASPTKEDALCYGTKGAIELTVQANNPPVKYQWSNNATTGELTDLNPGDYEYTVTDNIGCTLTGTVEILGASQPLFLEPEVFDEVCKDTRDGKIEINILNASAPVTFIWDDGSTGAIRDSLTKGEYKVTISDGNGCKIDSSFTIRTFCELDEEDFIPDVFSPNGDGINDLWNIPMLDRFPNHTVKVFNRWGNAIWSAKGDFTGWPGLNDNSEDAPIGAYFYVIELNDPTIDKVFKGTVTLVR